MTPHEQCVVFVTYWSQLSSAEWDSPEPPSTPGPVEKLLWVQKAIKRRVGFVLIVKAFNWVNEGHRAYPLCHVAQRPLTRREDTGIHAAIDPVQSAPLLSHLLCGCMTSAGRGSKLAQGWCEMWGTVAWTGVSAAQQNKIQSAAASQSQSPPSLPSTTHLPLLKWSSLSPSHSLSTSLSPFCHTD